MRGVAALTLFSALVTLGGKPEHTLQAAGGKPEHTLQAAGGKPEHTLQAAGTALPAPQSEFDRRLQTGETLYQHGKHDQAIKEFREAVRLQPNSAAAHLWMARALGRKAEKANPLRAAFLVGDVRKAFERAVELDPNYLEARSDLLEFYLEAPAMFGGGIDKARRQAEAIARLNKAEGHSARARIAQKEKRYDEAEREYRAAIESNPKHPGYRRDLESFLKKHEIQGPKAKVQSPRS